MSVTPAGDQFGPVRFAGTRGIVLCISQLRGLFRRLGLCWLFVVTWVAAFAPLSHGQCSFLASSGGKPLKYVFEPAVTNGKLIIHITAEFKGGRDGTMELELPSDWAGQSHLEAEITNLTA